MNKITREEFLALPPGVVYLEQSAQDIGPAIKGPTGEDGSFQKQVVRPANHGRAVQSVTCVQTQKDQTEFYIFDEVEILSCRALIFDHLTEWTPEVFQAKVLRLVETFAAMSNIRIRLPDGNTIRGDGKDFEPTGQGSSSIN